MGGGKTAEILIQHLEKSNHDIIIIDKLKEVVESITNRYSVNGVCGSGASRAVLASAGADTADALISLTPIDEINLLACSMAKNFGTRYTVAEVEREELISDKAYLKEKFGVDYILTPKDLAASAVADQIYFNSANRVEPFFDSSVLLAEIIVEKDSILANAKLGSIKPLLKSDFLVFGVLRGDKLMVPKGEFELHPGDVIGIIADKNEMTNLFSRVDLVREPVRSVMLIGGGDLGETLANRLIKHKISVKLIEINRDRCEELMSAIPKANIIFGNGTESLETDNRGEMTRFYSLGPEMLKISEFHIPVGFAKADMPLKSNDMKLKKGVIIGAIATDDRIIIPKGTDVIHYGDNIFILSESHLTIRSPMDIFA